MEFVHNKAFREMSEAFHFSPMISYTIILNSLLSVPPDTSHDLSKESHQALKKDMECEYIQSVLHVIVIKRCKLRKIYLRKAS